MLSSNATSSTAVPTRRKRVASSEYFSLANLKELCGIEDNIAFAETLIDGYVKLGGDSSGCAHAMPVGKEPYDTFEADRQKLFINEVRGRFVSVLVNRLKALANEQAGPLDGNNDWDRFRKMLSVIKDRQRDTKLNLSVVGEFSTGKSTFINALLRQKLLVSSPIQGTTLASTIIEQGDECSIEITFIEPKRTMREVFATPSRMRSRLSEVTTDETIARHLESVHVTLPTECFCPDIRIIDTPGTNAVEAWHEDVTIRTIKEQSDLSIVLVTADRLVTNTVLAFVKEHLRAILPQCVFVVTHIDHLEPGKDRDKQFNYIKKRIASELELEDPLVLPYASTKILDSLNHLGTGFPDVAHKKLINDSLKSEKLLRHHMVRMRLIVQTKSLMFLIDELYRRVSEHLEKTLNQQSEKVSLLAKAQKVDFSDFVSKQKTAKREKLESEIAVIQDAAEVSIAKRRDEAKGRVVGKIRQQISIDALKLHLESEVKPQFAAEMSQIADGAKEFYSSIRLAFDSLLDNFYSNFLSEYRHHGLPRLQILTNNIFYPVIASPSAGDLCVEMSKYVNEQQSKENSAIGAGAIAAGVVAAVATGGASLIWSIGAAIAGGIAGKKLAAPKVEDAREKCYNGLSDEFDRNFNLMRDRTLSALGFYGHNVVQLMDSEIDRYYASYKDAIESLIRSEQQEIKNTEERIQKMQRDMCVISERRMRLESVGTKLDSLTKGTKR